MLRKNNGYMPDILDCLANLSNDEVFTSPDVANKMLDLLPQEIFESTETTFLDPFTKTGVFLREITKRLLKNRIPDYEEMSSEIDKIEKEAIQESVKNKELDLNDIYYSEKAKKIGRDAIENNEKSKEYLMFERTLQKELNRIFSTQVFGIAITELTAQLARRSLYCSKDACGKYSVSSDFIDSDGNIRFKPTKHIWENDTCIYCGANKKMFDRPDDFEQHAYEFIHNEKVEEIFMGFQWTAIVGNPPYQIKDGGGTGDSAKPIYNKFVDTAIALNPKYITMIIPSRWMKGGKGLDSFREKMMNDKKIREMYDIENAKECFPTINLDGGVCYFIWDRDYNGKTKHTFKTFDGEVIESNRYLKNNISELIIRDCRQISIIEKIQKLNEDKFSTKVSARNPYGFCADTFNRPENYPNAHLSLTERENAIKIYGVKGKKGGAKRIIGWVDKCSITKNNESINKYKLFFSKAYSSNAINFPAVIKGMANDICTETFLKIGDFDTKEEMENCYAYMHTNFFKVLLFFNRSGMNNSQSAFDLIPWQDFSRSYSDIELYKKYNFSDDEIAFIEKIATRGKKDEIKEEE